MVDEDCAWTVGMTSAYLLCQSIMSRWASTTPLALAPLEASLAKLVGSRLRVPKCSYLSRQPLEDVFVSEPLSSHGSMNFFLLTKTQSSGTFHHQSRPRVQPSRIEQLLTRLRYCQCSFLSVLVRWDRTLDICWTNYCSVLNVLYCLPPSGILAVVINWLDCLKRLRAYRSPFVAIYVAIQRKVWSEIIIIDAYQLKLVFWFT